MFGAISETFYLGLIPKNWAMGADGSLPGMWILGFVIVALIGYILGSFNFALILSKRMYGEDIRNHGSKNAGTTNMARIYGKKAALFTILGDIMKGIVAVFLGTLVMGAIFGGYFAGLFCVLGHIFPVFYKFRGGKGVATAAAVILVLNPWVCLIILGVFVLTMILTKYVSLGSCLAAGVFPFFTYYSFVLAEKPVENFGFAFICSFTMALIVICKHHTNLRRLANGEEKKFSFKKKDDPAEPSAIYTAKKKKKETKYKVNKKK